MEDFFGLEVNESTFDHRKDNHFGTADTLFEEDSVYGDSAYNFNSIKFFYLGGCDMLLVLRRQTSLYFRGVLSVKCLAGDVEVNGFIIRDNSKYPNYVYSLGSHSALCFSSVGGTVKVEDNLKKTLKNMNAEHYFESLAEEPPFSCLLLVSRHKLDGFEDLGKSEKQALMPKRRFYSGTNYFSEAEECLNCIFDVPTGNRINSKMVYNQEFTDFVEELTFHSSPRTAVCGGKGVGKSTALRFIANKLLSLEKSILFIDFDIGQPEFTLPGCVSITLVTEPLLGPSYTHTTTPLRSIFLGFVNADLCLESYIKAIEDLRDYCESNSEFSSIPWLINTMGYIKGCGLLLLNDILSKFKLSHIFQLNGADFKLNSCFSLMSTQLPFETKNNCVLKSFLISPSSNTTSNITPRTFRELLVSFYFHKYKSELMPQLVPIDSNSFKPDENSVDYMCLLPSHNNWLKGDVVAICSNSRNELKICIGYGLVESFVDNILKIVTPIQCSMYNDICILRCDFELSSDFSYEMNYKHCRNEVKSCLLSIDGAKTRCPSLFSYIPWRTPH